MKLSKILQGCTVALATIGIAVPHAAMGAGITANTAKPAIKIADVALGQGGVLKGQIVNAQGVGLSDREVRIHHQGKEVARTNSDAQGHFSAAGLTAGSYVVATQDAEGPVRAWAYRTAPPAAAQGILLVPGATTARGQSPFGINPGLILVGAFVGTVVAVAVDDPNAS